MRRAFIINYLAALVLGGLFIWCLSLVPVRAVECAGRWVHASWYGAESGNRTATGDHFDGSSLTAAMPSRKHFGERYRVTFRGKSVTVRINDLGPHKSLGRGIDLSRAAADKIGMRRAGVAKVCIERVR